MSAWLPRPRRRSRASMIRRTSWMVSPCSVVGPHTVLNPLNSPGLWLPVIMTAPLASRCTAEKYSTGVGTTPISVTSQPDSTRPSSSASRRRGELSRQSRPSVMERPLWRCSKVPRPRPRSTMSELSSSVSATPRISYSRKIVGFNMFFSLSAYEPVSLYEESQRPIGAMPDADAGGNADAQRFWKRGRVNRQGAFCKIGSVVAAAYAQSQRQLARTIGQIFDAARSGSAPLHARDSLQRFHGAEQNASGAAFRLGHHVQALVHAVDEVHIGVAGLAEQHARARSDAAPGVRRPVLETQVGFRLDDPAGSRPVHQDGSQQRARDLDRWPL